MKFPSIIAAALVLTTTATAQERTAGQAYDAQVNWAAMKNSIDLVSSQNKALAAALDKLMACNAKKKVFAPTDSKADDDGCVSNGIEEAQGFAVSAPTAAESSKFKHPTGEFYGLFHKPAYTMDWNAYCRSKGYLFWSGANTVTSLVKQDPSVVTNAQSTQSSTLYCVGLPH